MASASTSEHATLMQKEAPCGCIMQVGAGEAMGTTTTTTTSKCPCECCGEGCRCIEVKGKCDCAEKMQAAAQEVHHAATTPAMVSTTTVTAPVGCVVEAGNEETCPTCGGKGCKCIALKGRCDCLDDK